jgi:type I restriction enzyme S subunit
MELKKVKLGDICEIYAGGDAPKNTTTYRTEENNIPVFSNGIENDGLYGFTSIPKIVKPSVTISARGTIGIPFLRKDPYVPIVRLLSAIPKEDKIDLYYLYYATKLLKYKKDGSVQQQLTVPMLADVTIQIPPLSEQKKIAAVLSALDDKIALNKKMNQKLERMAKRLYDYWFVQFDFPNKNGHPYKTTGGPMTYNPTLKREIPVGWKVKNVNDVTTSVRGVSYSSDDEKSKTDSNVVQILRGNNISGSRFVFDSNDVFVSSDLVAEEQKISKFDIVMTMSSGSKEHVGKSALALYDMPYSFGAFCSKFTSNEEARYFIDCYLHSEIFIKYIRQTCSGTGINNLTNGHFDKSLFAWPTEDILKAFNEKVSAIYEQRGVIEREITRLTALRDKLLPLLMNGQVIVRRNMQ